MNRRNFLAASSAFALPKSNPSFEFEEASLSGIQERFDRQTLTAEALTHLYLKRIVELDQQGPALRSVIEVNPDAAEIARSLDAERKAKGARGPLHGIPVLLKDNIDTADRMQTTAGSLALVGTRPARDAALVKRLRAAGAVILGKTNLSEWANFRSTHSTSGWSGRGGQTHNPYALDRNPCGSSSGSAVAVSANLCMLAVGTETDGSVVCPAAMCGIVGIKPTLGAISQAGIIPIAHSQDTAGPMARSVRDAAILLRALSGVRNQDWSFDPDGLRGARIGVARQYFNIGPAVTAIMEAALQVMKEAGATLVDPADLPTFETWRDTETEVLLYEFKADLNSYLATRQAQVRSMADCIEFNRVHRDREMPYFQQELMEQAQAKGPLTEKAYKDALARNRKLTGKDGIDAVVKKHKLDAMVGPTAGPAWLTDWVGGDRADSGCASPPAVAGYPHITVPAGQHFGLPIGLSFFGVAWSEPTLLRLAYAFEQASKARRKPDFRPTVRYDLSRSRANEK